MKNLTSGKDVPIKTSTEKKSTEFFFLEKTFNANLFKIRRDRMEENEQNDITYIFFFCMEKLGVRLIEIHIFFFI